MDPTKETSYRLQMASSGDGGALPDAFFHIGGDEVCYTRDASARVSAFKKRKGFREKLCDLQAYIDERISRIVTRHGKQMMGWDEILDAHLPKQTVVQGMAGPGRARGLGEGFRRRAELGLSTTCTGRWCATTPSSRSRRGRRPGRRGEGAHPWRGGQVRSSRSTRGWAADRGDR